LSILIQRMLRSDSDDANDAIDTSNTIYCLHVTHPPGFFLEYFTFNR
jgi:hypothetical protein